MASTGAPLRLKDLLELDCDSCSAAGFRCYPRRLGESSPISPSFRRAPSLRRTSKLSHLSRSLSRRLRGGFWRRRDEEAAVAASSCSSEQETLSKSSDSSGRTRRSRSESDSEFSSASSALESMYAVAAAATGDEHEEAMKRGSTSVSEVDDKEQLSPVAIMDFPCYDDDVEDGPGACSPSSDGSLDHLQRRQVHKIRRFGSLHELGPVDLEARIAASPDPDDQDGVLMQQLRCNADLTTPQHPSCSHRGTDVHEVPDEHGLLTLLMDTVSVGVDDVSERLLLDFFVEMKVKRRLQQAGLPAPADPLPRKSERLGDDEALAAAMGWLLDSAGAERWGLKEVLRGGETVVAEMERGRRWMQVGEEEREVGAVVAGVLTDQLVDEVVTELLVL